jgi:hypothetical protein
VVVFSKKNEKAMADYLARSSRWSFQDRRDVFELIISILQENRNDVASTEFIKKAVPALYANKTCPLGQVAAADYEPPRYIEIKELPI